jgi:hypothetical protein
MNVCDNSKEEIKTPRSSKGNFSAVADALPGTKMLCVLCAFRSFFLVEEKKVKIPGRVSIERSEGEIYFHCR